MPKSDLLIIHETSIMHTGIKPLANICFSQLINHYVQAARDIRAV